MYPATVRCNAHHHLLNLLKLPVPFGTPASVTASVIDTMYLVVVDTAAPRG